MTKIEKVIVSNCKLKSRVDITILLGKMNSRKITLSRTKKDSSFGSKLYWTKNVNHKLLYSLQLGKTYIRQKRKRKIWRS